MPTTLELQDRTVDSFISDINNETALPNTPVNEKALLIENMILTKPDEPRKKINVPNRLLETKIYTKLGQNDYVQAKPSEILFEGFEVGKKQTRQLLLLNASSDVIRLHIIPPQTDNFSIKYTKPERMVAGMILKCIVEFSPNEWRYYYDCIRIHCQGEENLIVPIHGYPVMNTKDFPRNYTFQPIAVGKSTSRSFPLKSLAPIDFEFCFKFIQRHPAFQIEPTSGIVPANGETEITVTFAPLEYQTAIMKLELVVSQLNFKGLISTFTGSSHYCPLMAKPFPSLQSEVLDPKCVTPIERARSLKKSKEKTKTSKKGKAESSQMPLEKNGIQFPQAIDSPSAVAKVLLQKPGKLKANKIRQNMQQQKEGSETTRQMKEALFEQLVRQNVYEERQNQLRWQVKLGDKPMTLGEKLKTLEERSVANTYYRNKVQGVPVETEEFLRPNTVSMYRRTFRDVESVAEEIATFDIYSNDMWDARHAVLDRFIQAARRVIIRNRCVKRLSGLRTLKKTMSGDIHVQGESKCTFDSVDGTAGFKLSKIKKHTFPTYLSPTVKDDMAPDALGSVHTPMTEIVIKRDVPFFNLKVPLYYQLYGYKPHNVHEAASGYVPVRNLRKLRSGAEDEEIRLLEEPDPCQTKADFSKVAKTAESGDPTASAEKKNITLSLTPPESLFKPMDYPSLHIMNPSPGLQVFQPSIPYSEVDFDFHLCPLPRYPRNDRTVTQKKTLNREDTIRGTMTWKKFPSPGLSHLSNSSSLSNIWLPRWSQCFSSDILPSETPAFMTRLEADDADNCVDELEATDVKTDAVVSLNPEMIEAQFLLIQSDKHNETPPSPGEKLPNTKMPNMPLGSSGPAMRDQCEKELNIYISQKLDKLGSQFRTKLDSLNALYTDSSFIAQ